MASEPVQTNATVSGVGTAGAGILLLPILLFIAALWAALSFDIVRTGFGVKGDEATYVAMGLSLAYDGDLAFRREDLERFYRIYQTGPEGIFLKRGTDLQVDLHASWPFVRLLAEPDSRDDRLYFGKSYLHAVVAAPLVRVAGLNGFLVLHVLLLAGVTAAGYVFLAARSPSTPAMLFTAAFLGASIAPLYGVWLTPETLNFALVFYAYFLWLYKEVAAPAGGRLSRWLAGWPSDVAAAVLLGLATFSKPINLLLVLPLMGLAWWRRRFAAGLMTGVIFGTVVAGAFGLNMWVSGELNYQGGNRKTFYGKFPFEQPDATFENRGTPVATDELDPEGVLDRESAAARFVHNVRYFFIGRHFGLVPFYFPAVVALALWIGRWRTLRAWHGLTLTAVAATVMVLLVWLPYTWSGGGGPLGNRYFLSIYPVFFFLAPPVQTILPGLAAWAGGALFTAHILANPFVASNQPWTNTQQGALRWLPVELTAAYDLPVMLSASRCRIPYGADLQLCLLDENAFRPERSRIWIAGASRAEIIIRSAVPVPTLTVTLYSPVANVVEVRSGSAGEEIALEADRPTTVSLRPFGLSARYAYAYLISVETERGFVPRLTDPGSRDSRFLGVQVQLSAGSELPSWPASRS